MTTPTTRRAILGATTALAAAALPAVAAVQPDEDPIFAVIAGHKAAMAKCAAADHEGLTYEESNALSDALCDFQADALWTLFETTPTTLPGVAALLRHLTRHHCDDPSQPSILFEAPNSFVKDLAEEWLVRLANATTAMAAEAGR